MRFSQIKQALAEAQIIDEVSMAPSDLNKWLNSPEAEGMLMGVEFEMCVPNVAEDDEGDLEPDYDYDEPVYSVQDIREFFTGGDYSNYSAGSRVWDELEEKYFDWVEDNVDRYRDNNQSDMDDLIRDQLLDNLDWTDYKDAAQEQLGTLLPSTPKEVSAVDQTAKDMLRAYVEKVIEQGGATDEREYWPALEQAVEQMRDAMNEDADYDQGAWLQDLGIGSAQEAGDEFGLDWPHLSYSGGGGEVSVDDIGEEFAEAMGLEKVNTSSGYHGGRRDGVHWNIEPDGSIDADSGDGGLEFISPPLPLAQGMEAIKNLKAWAKSKGCYTNKSTGLHMNISVPDMTVESLDYVKLAIFMGDKHVLEQFGRSYNNFAKSGMEMVQDKIKGASPEVVNTILAKMKTHLNAEASKLIHSGITSKYTSINTKENYVEFRGPGGDYLDMDLDKLLNTSLRLAMSLRIATDPNAHKQEYAKKLYKLVAEKKPDNDPVALFTKYATGEVDKGNLLIALRAQAQKRRAKNVPNEPEGAMQQWWVMKKDGTGGKQMVYASTERLAKIKGGIQMGMSAVASYNELTAELTDMESRIALPAVWQQWADNIENSPTNDLQQQASNIRSGLQTVPDGTREYILHIINTELDRRNGSNTATGLSNDIPENWQPYLRNMADKPLGAIVDMRLSVIGGDYDNSTNPSGGIDNQQQKNAIVAALDVELRRRQDAGETNDGDAEPAGEWARWTVTDTGAAHGNTNTFMVGARNEQEARNDVSQSQDIPLYRLTAARGGRDNTPSGREVYDSLSWVMRSWLDSLSEHSPEDLQRRIDNTLSLSGVMTQEQQDYVINTINQELQRRRAASDADMSSPDDEDIDDIMGGDDNATADTSPVDWPGEWDTIVNELDTYLTRTLEAIKSNLANGEYPGLTAEQRSGIIDKIDANLNARSNAGDVAAYDAAQNNTTAPTNESITRMRKLAGLNNKV